MMYTGAMEKGQMHGKGGLVYPNGEKYEVSAVAAPYSGSVRALGAQALCVCACACALAGACAQLQLALLLPSLQ